MTFTDGSIVIDSVALDVAYQFRFGRGVVSSFFKSWGFSEDVCEQTTYLSLIVRF